MAATGGTVGMTFAQIKPGQTLKATVPGIRQMQIQQIPIAQQQQRKNAAGATSRLVSHWAFVAHPHTHTFCFFLLLFA